MLYQKAIKLFKEKLKEVYGERLLDVILYGSYARNQQGEESDIDLLVLLTDIKDFWKEVHTINDIEFQINDSFDFNILISAIPASIKDFNSKQTPLFLNIKRDGIPV